MGLGRGGSASSVGTKVPSYSLSARPEGNRDSTERKFIWASEIISMDLHFFVNLDCLLRHKWRRLECKKKVKMILSSVGTRPIMRRCVSWRHFHLWLNEFVFHETNDKQCFPKCAIWPKPRQEYIFNQQRSNWRILFRKLFFFCKTKPWGLEVSQ